MRTNGQDQNSYGMDPTVSKIQMMRSTPQISYPELSHQPSLNPIGSNSRRYGTTLSVMDSVVGPQPNSTTNNQLNSHRTSSAPSSGPLTVRSIGVNSALLGSTATADFGYSNSEENVDSEVHIEEFSAVTVPIGEDVNKFLRSQSFSQEESKKGGDQPRPRLERDSITGDEARQNPAGVGLHSSTTTAPFPQNKLIKSVPGDISRTDSTVLSNPVYTNLSSINISNHLVTQSARKTSDVQMQQQQQQQQTAGISRCIPLPIPSPPSIYLSQPNKSEMKKDTIPPTINVIESYHQSSIPLITTPIGRDALSSPESRQSMVAPKVIIRPVSQRTEEANFYASEVAHKFSPQSTEVRIADDRYSVR